MTQTEKIDGLILEADRKAAPKRLFRYPGLDEQDLKMHNRPIRLNALENLDDLEETS